ncbi:MAG: hypothetical protein ACTIJ6_10715 [Leucobacter sp.]
MRLILTLFGTTVIVAYAVVGALLMNNWAIVAASGVSLEDAIATMHEANQQYSPVPGLIFSAVGIALASGWAILTLLPQTSTPVWVAVSLWAAIIVCGAPAFFFASFSNMNSVGDAFYDWDASAAFSLEAPLYAASFIAFFVVVTSLIIAVIKSSSQKRSTAQPSSLSMRTDGISADNEPPGVDRIRSDYAAPYYLSIPNLDTAGLEQFVELATSAELDEVLWMLSTKEWRCRKAGAWFALVRDEPEIDEALRISLLTSTDGLSSPDLAVCLSERLGAASLPALLEYESIGTHDQHGPRRSVTALITALGGTPGFDDATERVSTQVAAMRETARRIIVLASADEPDKTQVTSFPERPLL